MNVALYLYDGYFETEICIPTLLFKNENLFTISSDQEVITCVDGKRVLIDKKINEVKPEEIDVLIIPGGKAIIKEDILALIKSCEENGTIIGGICGGVDYMAHAGVLSSRSFTGYYQQNETYDHLPTNGTLTYSMYESDRKIVSAKPEAYLEFALELYHLAGFEVKSVDGYIEWFKSPFCWKK
ncbi:DJ-1/PfpI family protein [Abyssisolibacter fermentans]|uniref:DJ-1/PfpI family protein n=1 Tax=Abyssisolibacter fermentans TaxID=1766203 RepID=UPI00082FB516|nr:DJ-1/PfpI family protein [Abyssisolibacter fermentans]